MLINDSNKNTPVSLMGSSVNGHSTATNTTNTTENNNTNNTNSTNPDTKNINSNTTNTNNNHNNSNIDPLANNTNSSNINNLNINPINSNNMNYNTNVTDAILNANQSSFNNANSNPNTLTQANILANLDSSIIDSTIAADVDKRLSLHSSDGSSILNSNSILNPAFPPNNNNNNNTNNNLTFNNNYSAPNSRHRSSFDTNAKLGSFVHSNDMMKSPYLASFPAFRQSFTSSGLETSSNINSNGNNDNNPQNISPNLPIPPLSSPSMLLSYISENKESTITNSNNMVTSPLSTGKNLNLNEIPPLSQDVFSSPLTKPFDNNINNSNNNNIINNNNNNGNTSRLGSIQGIGMFPNIEELTLDNPPLTNPNDVSLFSQYNQLHRNSLNSMWGDNMSIDNTTNSTTNSNRNSIGMTSLNFKNNNQPQPNNPYNWISPPTADFQPLRRYSYDAASATTFVPNRNNSVGYDYNNNNYNYNYNSNINNTTNNVQSYDSKNYDYSNTSYTSKNNNNYKNNNGNGNNGHSYSRHQSLGGPSMITPTQYNHLTHRSNIITPSKEQIIQSLNDVSNYLGEPSKEVLDIENYLSYLNNSSLPQLTYFTDSNNLSNYDIIACCFKNSRIDVFHISPINKQLLGEIKIGDLVIVEADRGRDLGKVVKLNVSLLEARLLRYAQYLSRKAALSKDDEIGHKKPILNFPKPVIRFAKNEELLTINSKINDEIKAVDVCQNKVLEYGLNMKIVDAEYQWDMKKLTFYYNSEVRIDFRDLVKELFRVYKIRIWMSKQGGIC